jgi:DNA-binding transcriptional LysR family regulator
VVRHRGVTAASRKMSYGIQQPAISGQISQLEKRLGTRLFHRRPFGLTSSGARLFHEIEPFFAGLAELPNYVRGNPSSRLRLAAPGIILRDYLPKIFEGYKRRHREFRLGLHDANQAMAEELLKKREVDLAITELEGKPASPIQSCTLVRLPLVLVVTKRSTFRSIEDLFREGKPSQSLISLPHDEVIAKHFHSGLKKMKLAWATSIEVTSLELIELYTALGFGIGLSLEIPNRRLTKGLRVVPLRNFPSLTVAALWIGDLSDLAATFLGDIKKLASGLAR